MLTIILTATFFGGGVCYLDFYNGSSFVEQVMDTLLIGASLGLLAGVPLSFIITMIVSRKYTPTGEKIALLPFSDGKTYLVRNEHGDISYRPPCGEVIIAQSVEIAFLEVRKEVEFPYFSYCKVERNSLWGIFAWFFLLSNHKIFILPNETMIMDGWVKINEEYEIVLA